ncbi:MAG: putative poly(glycerol-phosphate) alpha-glucosyltransferase [Alphaproteobacteria bacterium MarineAlpha9_Bin4]|nr:hypothetical protein [Pelagibacterales bacterium]PPR26073.1 MAG: putative poly(glycerol-phosphate) alpha-glucosyltransferase [Alphaproteobacteria bacterium MarineAlpha9_Bin4]
MQKKKYKIFSIVSLDKKPGGISAMIQLSTMAIASNCNIVNLLLTNAILENKEFSINLSKIKNLVLKNLSFTDRQFFKFSLLRSSMRESLKDSDIIFVHNSKLLKVIRNYFPEKKIVMFFHTDKLSQLQDFQYADKVVTVNKTMEKKINDIFFGKAIYIPNSIKKEKSQKNQLHRSKSCHANKKLKVGGMGRLVKKKGFDFLVKTCMKIDNVELLIAGNGIEFNKLKRISNNNNNINLLGWIENKDLFFKKIDVFCCSSYEEPFGLVIIEAMSRGIPVISTNCNGPIDIIKNNIDGLLIEKNNVTELKSAITRLRDSIDLRLKLGKNAKKKYKKYFTFDEYLKNINSLIKNLRD